MSNSIFFCLISTTNIIALQKLMKEKALCSEAIRELRVAGGNERIYEAGMSIGVQMQSVSCQQTW